MYFNFVTRRDGGSPESVVVKVIKCSPQTPRRHSILSVSASDSAFCRCCILFLLACLHRKNFHWCSLLRVHRRCYSLLRMISSASATSSCFLSYLPPAPPSPPRHVHQSPPFHLPLLHPLASCPYLPPAPHSPPRQTILRDLFDLHREGGAS